MTAAVPTINLVTSAQNTPWLDKVVAHDKDVDTATPAVPANELAAVHTTQAPKYLVA